MIEYDDIAYIPFNKIEQGKTYLYVSKTASTVWLIKIQDITSYETGSHVSFETAKPNGRLTGLTYHFKDTDYGKTRKCRYIV